MENPNQPARRSLDEGGNQTDPTEVQFNPLKPHEKYHKFFAYAFVILCLLAICAGIYYWQTSDQVTGLNFLGIHHKFQYEEDKTNTIAGIDADNNGIRDDIQKYIAIKYASQPDMIKVLDAYAKAQELFMIEGESSKAASVKYDAQRSVPTECLVSIKGDEGWTIRNDIRDRLANTPARFKAYDTSDNHLSGMIFTPPPLSKWGEQCKGILNPSSPTSAVDTSTWKTYTNSQYGFEFKYPDGWNLSLDALGAEKPKIKPDGNWTSSPAVSVGISDPLDKVTPYKVYFIISSNPKNYNATDSATQAINTLANDPKFTINYKNKFPLIINGQQAYELYDVTLGKSPLRFEDIYFTNNNYMVYLISFMVADENQPSVNSKENNNIAHQILSTFKFTK